MNLTTNHVNNCYSHTFDIYLIVMQGFQLGNLFFSEMGINVFIRLLCVITSFIIFLKSERHKRYNQVYEIFQVFVLCIGFWDVFYIGYMIINDPKIVTLCNSMIYANNSFAATYWFLFTFAFTFPASKKRIKHILVVPALTAFFSMTYMFHGFMLSYDYVLTDEITRVPEHHGPWFFVHLVYSYSIVVAGIIILFIKLRKKTTPNKKTVFTIILGSSFLILWNFIFTVLTDYTSLSVALSGCAHLFCIITIYMGICFDNVERMILLTGKYREDLFPIPIFITDNHGIVVYFNSAAEGIVKKKSFSPYGEFLFEDFLANYTKTELPKNVPAIGNHAGFMLEDSSNHMVWYVQEQSIHNKLSIKMGAFYTFNNISYINRIMALLEKYAFRDMLTGAYNRHFFEMKKDTILETSQSVITLVMCDIDNLKKVNDIYGHAEGDNYIKSCSKTLFSSVRKKDLIFRIGGDEFLIMLPDTEENASKVIINRIYENLELPKYDKSFGTGLSIGSATSQVNNSRDFIALMDQADKAMYRNKQEHKALRQSS